jgi:uncharacterized protein (TIGR02246 family)
MDPMQVGGELAAGFASAWNQHNMAALGELFHDNAAFVNVVGTYMRGRQEIQQSHGAAHAGFYRNSALRVEVEDAREVVPGLIVAHVHSEVSGDDRAPGEVRRTLLTLVIERRADRWRIIAGHNTVVTTTPG